MEALEDAGAEADAAAAARAARRASSAGVIAMTPIATVHAASRSHRTSCRIPRRRVTTGGDGAGAGRGRADIACASAIAGTRTVASAAGGVPCTSTTGWGTNTCGMGYRPGDSPDDAVFEEELLVAAAPTEPLRRRRRPWLTRARRVVEALQQHLRRHPRHVRDRDLRAAQQLVLEPHLHVAQAADHLQRRGSKLRPVLQAALEQRFEMRGKVRPEIVEETQGHLQHVERGLGHAEVGAEPVVRQREGEHLVEDEAQRVDVARLRDRAPVELLGRGVLTRAAEDARARGGRIFVDQRGDTEVEELDHVRAVALLGEKDVLGFDVAVNDAHLVRVGERQGDLGNRAGDLEDLEGVLLRALVLDARAQRRAVQALHHDVGEAVRVLGDAGGEHLDDVRRAPVQLHDRGGLVLHELARQGALRGDAGAQDLDGDLAIAGGVDRAVDDGHAALAEDAADGVLAGDEIVRLVRGSIVAGGHGRWIVVAREGPGAVTRLRGVYDGRYDEIGSRLAARLIPAAVPSPVGDAPARSPRRRRPSSLRSSR